MSQRYECGAAADTDVEVVAPGNPWHPIWDTDPRPPAPGTRALVIGNPWASAYAVIGTPPELEQFITAQMATLHRACAEQLTAHAEPAVTYDPALLADWLATNADTLRLTGHYTPADNIAARLQDLLVELGSQPQLWRTAAAVGRIRVYPTALADPELADVAAVLTIDVGPVRLATDPLAGTDLTGLAWDGDQQPSMPWPQAAQRAITAAAEAANTIVARWRAATAFCAAGRPTADQPPPRPDHTR
jgi:hypothetical protein